MENQIAIRNRRGNDIIRRGLTDKSSSGGDGQSATNTVRLVLVFTRVCSYHGVYSFIFVGCNDL
jgi:hypothetical protein